MKVLVTGGSGNLGKYVVEEMKSHGHDVTVFDAKEPQDKSVKFAKGDLLKLSDLENACEGMEAVIHLAAIANPNLAEHEVVFNVNVMGTFNALEASMKRKVRRFVLASSDSTLGFLFRVNPPISPEYLPVNEGHPLKTEDPYGLSKKVGEELCLMFSRRYGLETVCLRICYIWFPGEFRYGENVGSPEGYRGLTEDPGAWGPGLWVYQDARDAAQAFRLGAEVPGIKHEKIFICAGDNGTKVDSLELIKKYYPGVKKVDQVKLAGRAPLISIEKAKRVLGYKPAHPWQDLFSK